MNHLMYSLCLLLIPLQLVHSQDMKTDSTKTYYIEPVVITGTQSSLSRKLVPSSVSVVSSTDLQSSGKITILDALGEEVPGLYVAQRGIMGYGINTPAGAISIRGLGGSPDTQVLVMIDGVPQFMGLMGHPLPDSYLSEDASRVEVIRGPASVLYGTNAMGGVINIITKKAETKGLGMTGGISYGSFDTQEYNAGIGYRKEKFDLLITGDHDQTDGHRAYSSFKTSNGYINTGYEISNALNVRIMGSANKFYSYDPGPASAPKINNWYDVFRGSFSVSLNDNLSDVDGSLKLFSNYGEHKIYDGFHSLDRNLGTVFYQNIHFFGGNTSTIGLDYQHYGGSATGSSINYGKHYIDELGVYVLLEQLLFEKLMLNAGGRLQHSSTYGTELVPEIGASWLVTSSTTLKASVAKGFRSPTIRELYLFPAPNPNLKPERLWNYEIGILQSFAEHVSLELTGFVAKGSNLILTQGVYPNLQLTNSGSFTHKGVEFAAHYSPHTDLRFDASYSFIEPEQQTYETPKHKLYIGADYSYKEVSVNLIFQHIAVLYGANGSQKRMPDYTLVSVRISYQVTGFANIYLSGDNLLNTSYQMVYDYPMPGRTFFLGLKLHFKGLES
jgi:outer membrane cobalamin receptor